MRRTHPLPLLHLPAHSDPRHLQRPPSPLSLLPSPLHPFPSSLLPPHPLQILVTSLTLLVPCWAVATQRGDPADVAIPGFLLVGSTIVLWMKLVSYAHCGHDCRSLRRAGEPLPGEKGYEGNPEDTPGHVSYPDNLTVQNMVRSRRPPHAIALFLSTDCRACIAALLDAPSLLHRCFFDT